MTASRNRINDATPLHLASEGGHEQVTKLLIDAGASPIDENKVHLNEINQQKIKTINLFF